MYIYLILNESFCFIVEYKRIFSFKHISKHLESRLYMRHVSVISMQYKYLIKCEIVFYCYWLGYWYENDEQNADLYK